MSIFRRRAVERGIPSSAYYQYIRDQDGVSTDTGVYVDGDSALRHGAVWASVNRIAQTVAMLPSDAVSGEGNTRTPVRPTPQIIAQPSLKVSATDWQYQVLVSALLRGNSFGDVTEYESRGAKRYATRIEIRHPDTVDIHHRTGEITVNGEDRKLFPVGDLWHFSAYTLPGHIFGLSPIAYHATTIGAGLAAEKFGAQFFPGGHPTWIMKSKSNITEDQAKAAKKAWKNATSGGREVAVLGGDWELTQIQINPQDSQFLELMRYTAEDVARVFGLDPTDIGVAASGSSVTYANREQRQQDRLVYPIGWWLVKLERAVTDLCPPSVAMKKNTGALLRADTLTRYQAHQIALKNKWTSVNRVLALEDQEPFAGAEFDLPGVPGGGERGLSLVEAIQKIYLGVGVVLSADEARKILNDMGAGLTGPAPEGGASGTP